MVLVRPHVLFFQPRACAERVLQRLLENTPDAGWTAVAPHLGKECALELGDLAVFESLAPGECRDDAVLASRFGAERIDRLLAMGLLIGDHPAHRELRRRDAKLRDGWWGPAALMQVFGRWDGVDVAADERAHGRRGAQRLIAESGTPPPEALELADAAARIPLPGPTRSALDDWLRARLTCRNFDPDAVLDAASLATTLHRVFAAQASLQLAPGARMLKKTSPSGGGLHPIEAFVLVQRVEGLAAGTYHYHCLHHALEPIASLSGADAFAAATELVAGQAWFANAPVLVLMAARFARTHWKYPDHAKAWKVVQLDAGHLSQTLMLSATEQGLGAFITAAINDVCAERLFGLDGLDIGPVAVSGLGRRAAHSTVRELNPPPPAP